MSLCLTMRRLLVPDSYFSSHNTHKPDVYSLTNGCFVRDSQQETRTQNHISGKQICHVTLQTRAMGSKVTVEVMDARRGSAGYCVLGLFTIRPHQPAHFFRILFCLGFLSVCSCLRALVPPLSPSFAKDGTNRSWPTLLRVRGRRRLIGDLLKGFWHVAIAFDLLLMSPRIRAPNTGLLTPTLGTHFHSHGF